ncbi:MAG: phenylalanine--tRNA ligase subunit alpha [bacterium]|nr:phenylalanine--tRNA ligase subunit alpha [bacterium]
MLANIKQIEEDVVSRLKSITAAAELEEIRVGVLGKKGSLTQLLRGMKDLDQEQRKAVGKEANRVKNVLADQIKEKQEDLKSQDIRQTLTKGKDFDFTLPGTVFPSGSLHPVTIVQREVEKVFTGMGFRIVEGPEVESDFNNFEALNIPEHHPARDMQDTYWLENGQCLRTHTSPSQIRAMKRYGAPLRIIAPGRCFRNENIDASHENTFFQLEGMMVDKNISIANLIYIMKLLLKEILKRKIEIRLRPGYFPFVEPGFELDLKCEICGGKGCSTCKYEGWIELLPCGMVHPNVLRYGDIDPGQNTGFAFGLGLTRLAMMKYKISDIRVLNSGDLRVLKQFSTR